MVQYIWYYSFRLSDKWVKDFRTSFVVKEQRIQCYSCTEAYLSPQRKNFPQEWTQEPEERSGYVSSSWFKVRGDRFKAILYCLDWKLFIFHFMYQLKNNIPSLKILLEEFDPVSHLVLQMTVSWSPGRVAFVCLTTLLWFLLMMH